MANKATGLKGVTVEEIAKTSLVEAGIFNVSLPDRSRVVVIANTLWPTHDRNMHEQIMAYLRDFKPHAIVLLGHMINNEAFQALFEAEKNYLYRAKHPAEVLAAKAAGSFDAQVTHLRKQAGEYLSSFVVGDAKVFFIPAILTEHKLVKRLMQEKERRDNFVNNHPEAADQPSDPDKVIPRKPRDFFFLNTNPRVKVLPYNAALLANDHTLFMIGDFKRRNEGDAAHLEWQQRHYPAIIRSLDGKLASGWFSTTEHTQPTLIKKTFQVHEIGYLWNEVENGQLRDYDRRSPGFFAGTYVDGELFGTTIDIIRGDDGRRSFMGLDGTMYTEPTPGDLPNGVEVTLGDEETYKVSETLSGEDDDDDGDGDSAAPAADTPAPKAKSAAKSASTARKPRTRATTGKAKTAASKKPAAKPARKR